MKLVWRIVCVVVCGTVLSVPAVGHTQNWQGGYISGHLGSSMIPEGSANKNVVVFDTDLDGTFNDTVQTAAGANAFSPGFCIGSAASAVPSGGCAVDDRGVDFGLRGGYDWQSGALVLGAVAELAAPDHIDSISAFSTTPAFYTFTRELKWVSGFRGRAGAGVGSVLIYGTAGAAWAKVDQSFTTSNTVNTFVEDSDDMAWGVQFGGGAEFKLGRIALGGEYLWTRLMDEDRYTVRSQGPAPATNPFILVNAAGTDLQRADGLEFGSLRFTAGVRF